MNIKCPNCQKEFEYYSSIYRPFCSDKCKTHDIADWADEKFRLATDERPSDLDLELEDQDKSNLN